MLSDGQITRMRATAERALTDTCAVQRKTTVSDGGGGTTSTWGPHLASVRCRLSPAAGGEDGVTGARISDESTHIVTLPAGTDVTEADRLVISGQTFEITLVRTRGRFEITRRVECKEAS